MTQPTFSICHPTARPYGFQISMQTWMRLADNPSSIEYILCVDEKWGFPKNFSYPGAVITYNKGRKCMVDSVNEAAKASTGKILIINSDDMFPEEHWDTKMLSKFPNLEDEFVLHVCTGSDRDETLITIQIETRKRYLRKGYAMYPEYDGMYADDDFTGHAYLDNCVIKAFDIMVEHRHPGLKKAPMDAVYAHENRAEAYRTGLQLFNQRKSRNFSS